MRIQAIINELVYKKSSTMIPIKLLSYAHKYIHRSRNAMLNTDNYLECEALAFSNAILPINLFHW